MTVDNFGDNVYKGQRHKSQMADNKARIGQIGESLACMFLMKQGYTVICRNYWKKWGEIDIVAQKVLQDKIDLRFVEVKTVSRETLDSGDNYEPEDNMHPWKRQRLRRVIETYILEKEEKGEINEDTDWQVDAISVYVDKEGNELKIEWLEDIVL